MRKLAAILGSAAVLVLALILARTLSYRSSAPQVTRVTAVSAPPGAAERLAGSLRIRTISHEDPAAFDAEAFRTLHGYLRTTFPRVHSQLACETVRTFSLLCTW